jgi:hypothetical protein
MLPPGSYTLELTIPEDVEGNPIGQNVIPGSYNVSYPTGTPGGFAVPADEVVLDLNRVAARATFGIWAGCCGGPVFPIGWSSMKTHGQPGLSCGELGIVLDPSSPVGTVETRVGGLTKLKVVFAGDLTMAGYQPGQVLIAPPLTVTGESLATTFLRNDTLLITFNGSTDLKCHRIDLSNVCWIWGHVDKDCLVRVQLGNVNGDCCTNLTDVALIKARNSSVPVMIQPFNALYDVNCDCLVNLTDVAQIKAKNSYQTTTACPP